MKFKNDLKILKMGRKLNERRASQKMISCSDHV